MIPQISVIVKKYAACLLFPFACFLLQCSSSDTQQASEPQANNPSELTEISGSANSPENTDTSAVKLPEWPIKARQVKGKRLPFDEAPEDPSFAEFRLRLYRAVLEKDLGFLNSAIHPDIKFSFGAENGKADFLKTWNLDTQPKSSDFWTELETVLSLGGGFMEFSKKGFYAPYIFVLRDIDDPFFQGVITGENVRLRESPSSGSTIIASLSWDLVEILDDDQPKEETIEGETHLWQKVKTENGKSGFVFGKFVRLPIDFRAGFNQYGGKWMMDLFIAGD